MRKQVDDTIFYRAEDGACSVVSAQFYYGKDRRAYRIIHEHKIEW